jgi:hypothetical protein
MKKVILMIVSALFCGIVLTNCNNRTELGEDEVITLSDGRTLHMENYQWLKNLINLSKTDKTGNCIGWIWLESYKGHDIFVTNMGLGSGGVMYWFFDSSGNHFIHKNWGYETCPACKFVGNHHVFFEDLWKDSEESDSFMLNMKLNNIVYSSFPFPYK